MPRVAFPPVTTAEWDAAIQHDLKGADYQKTLVWQLDEGIAVKPYYRSDDIGGLAAGTPPGVFPFERGTGVPWQALDPSSLPEDAIRADALHDAGAHAVQELAYAMAAGVDRLDTATTAGTPLLEAAAGTAFVFAVGSTYFVEIAKLRAARVLWAQVMAAYGAGDDPRAAMRLHVRTGRANKSTCDPFTNLLRCTTEAMSAAIGGADTVSVEPAGFDAHLADNVSRILDHESHMAAVTDPAAGSYYVEALTEMLAREAWQLFQRIEREGGFAAAVASGTVAAAVTATREARAREVATRARTLVGVNNYPDLTGRGAGPAALEGDDALLFGAERLAAPFERIRARTARHVEGGGRVPRVRLLTRGPVAARSARANFCLNFFGCAGFEITQGEELADAELLVLCSADREYVALARAIVPVSPCPVIVAGQPADQVEALRAAGVEGFVHAGSDAVQTLTHWQDRFGLRP